MTVRQGDTHAVYWKVTDGDVENGVPHEVDLSGMTAEIHVKLSAKGSPSIDLLAVVEESENRIRHNLTGTLAPGTYLLEIELTKDGVIATAPTAKNDTLTVVTQIA